MKNICQRLVLSIVLSVCILSSCQPKQSVEPVKVLPQSGIVTDTDGNVYHTVTIGTQTWLVENLKTTHYRDGAAIANATDSASWVNNATGAYCDYNNTPSNSAIYGRLYNWFAATNGHNICPKGWHVPSDAEWTTLTSFLGGESVAGGKLKETGTAHWASPNTGATNESGFSAFPGGTRYAQGVSSGSFDVIGNDGGWWSSTQLDPISAWYRSMFHDNGTVFRSSLTFRSGLSVRCVRD